MEKIKLTKRITSLILLFSFLFLILGVERVESQVVFQNPLRYNTLEELINAIIQFIFLISLGVAPLMIIIGAFFILTSGGNEKKVTTGKNIIYYSLIALGLILFARGLIAVIKNILGG